MSGTNPVHPCVRVLPAPAMKLLMVGGLTLAGWLLGVALSGTASADEQISGGSTETVAARSVQTADSTQTGDPTPSGATTAAPVTAVPVTAAPITTPAATTAADTTAPDTSAPDSTPADTAAPKKPALGATTAPKTSTHHSPLGGLLSPLVNTLTNTVNAVSHTVTGLTGMPLLPDLPAPPEDNTPCPAPLPGDGSIVPPLLGGDGGPVHSGSTLTISVPALRPGADVSITLPAPLDIPAAAPPAATAPQAAASHLSTATQKSTRSAPEIGQPAAIAQRSEAQAGGGSSGGGGQFPSAPSAPVGTTGTVIAGHDTAGGTRGPLAVLGFETNTTQLRLSGVARDHAADGAGRDAALPTTSPD